MDKYIGIKVVRAIKIAGVAIGKNGEATIAPEKREQETQFAKEGWASRFHGDENDMGYFVEYPDGYQSWSPTKVFEEAYKNASNPEMSFGDAILCMEQNFKVARKGWNGKGMFLFLVPGSTFKVNRPPLLGIYPEGTEINYHAHIDMKTADGKVVPWLASQTDMLAKDWIIV
tara:strand:- start:6087 stop:6602 length:516 start_codon:yes stop_codon:yes gene_type:complete